MIEVFGGSELLGSEVFGGSELLGSEVFGDSDVFGGFEVFGCSELLGSDDCGCPVLVVGKVKEGVTTATVDFPSSTKFAFASLMEIQATCTVTIIRLMLCSFFSL